MTNSPNIAIVVVGAIGGAVAGALGDAGRLVTLCVRTPFRELRVDIENSSARYSHPIVTDPNHVEPVDWLLLCTKAHQVDGASDWLGRLISPTTRVAVLQNGVEHKQRVVEYVTETDRVLPCVVRLPANVVEPGHVVQNQVAKAIHVRCLRCR